MSINPFLNSNSIGMNPTPKMSAKHVYSMQEDVMVDATASNGARASYVIPCSPVSSENFVDIVSDKLTCLKGAIANLENLKTILAPMQPSCEEGCCEKVNAKPSFDMIWDNLPQTLWGFANRIDSLYSFVGTSVYKTEELNEKSDKKAADNHVGRVSESIVGFLYSVNRFSNLPKILSGQEVSENSQETNKILQEASFTTVWKALPDVLQVALAELSKAKEEIMDLFLGTNKNYPTKC